ncbi:MAG: E3 ubiquitin protein ligase [Chlamydiales bacterium]|nr:E3 ubiquitin protein ligase [Chlamydiales bacterium]
MASSVQNRGMQVTQIEVPSDSQCPICYVTKQEELEQKIDAVWVGHNKTHVYHPDCVYKWVQRDVTQESRCPSLLCMQNLDSTSITPFISTKFMYQDRIKQLQENLQEQVEQLKESLPSLCIAAPGIAGMLSHIKILFEYIQEGETTISSVPYWIIPCATGLFLILGMLSPNPSQNVLSPSQTFILTALLTTSIYSSIFCAINKEFLQEIYVLNPKLNNKEENILINLIHFNLFSLLATLANFRKYFSERN